MSGEFETHTSTLLLCRLCGSSRNVPVVLREKENGMEDVLDREISDEELEKMLQRVKTADRFDASASADSPDSVLSENGEEVLTDDFGFPFEPEGLYNSDPIEFEEIVKALWTVLSSTNQAATRYNRLSPYYTMLMQRLEKDIK